MIFVIDGNDGTGKTTIVSKLKLLGYDARDRGLPTKMTDELDIHEILPNGYIYVILDCPIEVSQQRLAQRGADLNEKYHTVDDLIYYRQRFLDVAKILPSCMVVDATNTADEIVKEILGKKIA